MDTRTKILDAAGAAQLAVEWRNRSFPLKLVVGYFDVLLAEHARELIRARNGAANTTLVAVVLPSQRAVVDQRARAELVAALAMVDYVITAPEVGTRELLSAFAADEVIEQASTDERRLRELIEHVHRRQSV